LRSTHRLDSLLSREAVFLLNNLVLVGLCFVIFWGTFFPLISELATGTKASVGPPWFNRYTVPLALVLVLLTAVGPMFAWRRTTPRRLGRVLRWPLIAAAGTVAILVASTPAASSKTSLLMFAGVALVLSAVTRELVHGARARRSATGEALPVAAARRTTSTRPPIPPPDGSRASSTARRRARSRCAGACAATSGRRCSPTSPSCSGPSRWPTRSSASPTRRRRRRSSAPWARCTRRAGRRPSSG